MAVIAPAISVYVMPSGDSCHWYVIPAPFVLFATESETLLLTQTEESKAEALPPVGAPEQAFNETHVIAASQPA